MKFTSQDVFVSIAFIQIASGCYLHGIQVRSWGEFDAEKVKNFSKWSKFKLVVSGEGPTTESCQEHRNMSHRQVWRNNDDFIFKLFVFRKNSEQKSRWKRQQKLMTPDNTVVATKDYVDKFLFVKFFVEIIRQSLIPEWNHRRWKDIWLQIQTSDFASDVFPVQNKVFS